MVNWSLIEATWRHWKSPGLTWWSRLTDPEWEEVDGDREKLLDLLQLKYGWNRAEAEKQVEARFEEFAASL
jgi:hypothetical protein